MHSLKTEPFHLLDLFLSLKIDEMFTAAIHVHTHTIRQREEGCISRVRPVRAYAEKGRVWGSAILTR